MNRALHTMALTQIREETEWSLFFASHAPSEQVGGPKKKFTASHRQPYFVPLDVAIPQHADVATATGAELAGWIRPRL